ncbi:MAG: hypothetical protein ACT4OX_13000 [Actinomycetota bacterium]
MTTARRDSSIRARSVAELDEIEQCAKRDFAAFLTSIGAGERRFYLAFGPDQLHWVWKALSFVPDRIPIALVGSGLNDAEEKFVRDLFARPFHNIALRVDVSTVWEFLFECAEGDFGWLDTDCFVLDPTIFDALMEDMSESVMTRTAFTFEPLDLMRTPLWFWNAASLAHLRSEGPATTPGTYAMHPTAAGRYSSYAICRLIEAGHVEAIRSVVGFDAAGDINPNGGVVDVYDNGATLGSTSRHLAAFAFGEDARRVEQFLDPMILLQIVLLTKGFKNERLPVENRDISDRVVHSGRLGDRRTYRDRFPIIRDSGELTDALDELLIRAFLELQPPQTYVARLTSDVRQPGDEHVPFRPDRGAEHTAKVARFARRELARGGVETDLLKGDDRWSFLFQLA